MAEKFIKFVILSNIAVVTAGFFCMWQNWGWTSIVVILIIAIVNIAILRVKQKKLTHSYSDGKKRPPKTICENCKKKTDEYWEVEEDIKLCKECYVEIRMEMLGGNNE